MKITCPLEEVVKNRGNPKIKTDFVNLDEAINAILPLVDDLEIFGLSSEDDPVDYLIITKDNTWKSDDEKPFLNCRVIGLENRSNENWKKFCIWIDDSNIDYEKYYEEYL